MCLYSYLQGADTRNERRVEATASDERVAAALPIEQEYILLRKVAAVGVGNALEFYDFITFSFFDDKSADSK